MVTRRKTVWKLDERGQYSRQVGWKLSPAGKRVQHKFRLGSQLREVELRELKLRTLWESVERSCAPADAIWTETSLEMAKAIARGDTFALLPTLPGEGDEAFAFRTRQTTLSA